jgi:hypothetical protein
MSCSIFEFQGQDKEENGCKRLKRSVADRGPMSFLVDIHDEVEILAKLISNTIID